MIDKEKHENPEGEFITITSVVSQLYFEELMDGRESFRLHCLVSTDSRLKGSMLLLAHVSCCHERALWPSPYSTVIKSTRHDLPFDLLTSTPIDLSGIDPESERLSNELWGVFCERVRESTVNGDGGQCYSSSGSGGAYG